MPRTAKPARRRESASPISPKSKKKAITQYNHQAAERINNPPVGLVTPETDRETTTAKTYAYDPHLDPQLVWAGKAEHTSFQVPIVSVHVHERIDPRTIVEAVRRRNGDGNMQYQQLSLFNTLRENPPLREAIDFYKHKHNWSNRLIAGDSLLVMNSLLEKEGMAGQVQMIYIDPPYGIKYGSNFQPFVNKRDVKDGKDEDLTQEPEMITAFRDTWELGIHSYLTYLRDRLLLARELLHESGSVFVQISDENLHHVRELLDEIFGRDNFCLIISYQKTGGIPATLISPTMDFIIWYAKDKKQIKFRTLLLPRDLGDTSLDRYDQLELEDGTIRHLTTEEIQGSSKIPNGKRFQLTSLFSEGTSANSEKNFSFEGKTYAPPAGRHWKVSNLQSVAEKGRIMVMGSVLRYKRYLDDFPMKMITDRWDSVQLGAPRVYVVQTSLLAIQRCILLTTDPGDLVLDPTCGSGTTAYVAEQWGRRWITCDTSRVAITLAKQRLMTALFDYYELARPEEGVDSGFRYKTVPHITLKSIANNEPPAQETLYDQPIVDNSKARVTGPFTVEAVPAPIVRAIDSFGQDGGRTTEDRGEADESIARSGETLRQAEWRDELYRTGIRGKGGQKIEFTRVEPLSGTRWLHADAETKDYKPQRAVISFGPDFAPLEQRQVALALEEAQNLVPKPKLVIFAAFEFDPEAAKDIDETNFPGVSLLKAQMNTDLLTEDLKKKRSSNQSFWLIGQPDVRLEKIKSGEHKGQYQVEVSGFDYYNTRTGSIESGGTDKIAMWMLDTDYDGRSILPRQVFFPMAGDKDGWARLTKNLKAEIDEDLIEQYRGTVSLPFDVGKNERVAVKIVDDRGIESLKIIAVG